jgi:hypothetical protein
MIEEEIENCTPEELEERLKKGYYSKEYLEKIKESLKKEVGEEKTQVPDILHFYRDSAKNKEIAPNPNNGKMYLGEFEGYLHLYLFNDSDEAYISNLQFVFEDKDLSVVQVTQELAPKEMGTLVLNFHPSRPRALKTMMQYSYNAVYKPSEDD